MLGAETRKSWLSRKVQILNGCLISTRIFKQVLSSTSSKFVCSGKFLFGILCSQLSTSHISLL